MKMPVEWHKKNLENMRRYARQKRDEAEQALADAARLDRDCMMLDAQIIRAEHTDVKEFDWSGEEVKRRKRLKLLF